MTLIIQKPTGAKLVLAKNFSFDADAAAYIAAVEAADTQALETATRYAINDFVIGCKQDGTWSAIKASCILSGARTLTGALVPLAGTAPTNNNFVSGDYNRKTGLVGNGSTKYLNSNRNNNVDPQNSRHFSVYIQSRGSIASGARYIAAGTSSDNDTFINNLSSTELITAISNTSFDTTAYSGTGFAGCSRNTSSQYTFRAGQVDRLYSKSSGAPRSEDYGLFARGQGSGPYSDGRIAFYSIGESLDLALLDARVTDLINAFSAAIP
jgi:hypothetical protein